MSADTYSIHVKVDSSEVKNAGKDLEKLGVSSSAAESALKKLGSAASSVRSAFVLLVGVEIARFLRDTASATQQAADAYVDMRSKLDLATYSQKELNKAFKDSFDIANRYYTSVTDVASAYAKFNPIVASLGRSTNDTAKIVSSLSASLLISGNNTVDAAETFRQFAQAISGPKVQMEEMNTIIDSNQALWRGLQRQFPDIIAKYGSLKEAISKQAITNEMLINATIALGAEFEALAARKAPTVTNAMTVLKNSFTQYVGEADSATGASTTLSSALLDLAQAIAGVEGKGETLAKSVGLMSNAWVLFTTDVTNAKIALQEMIGLQQAGTADPEIQRLMKLGLGQVPIDDLADKPAKPTTQPQLTPRGTGVDAKKAAKEAKEALAVFKALIDAQVSAAENAARLRDAIGETAMMRLENELDAAKEKARLDSKEITNYEDKLRIAEELQKKSEEIIVKETELRLEAKARDEEILTSRIAGVEQEIAAASRFNLTQAERIRLETELATLQAQKQAIPEERTQIELDAISKLSDATKELNEIRKSGEESVRDEALRTLAVMESNLDFAKEMATGFSDAFGEMGDALGGFIVSLAEYEKQMATIKVQMDEEIAKNPSKRYEIEQKAAEKSAKAQINAYGDMAQSAQKFFKQGSKGYEAMGAAVKVFRTFEMAQSAISAASQIGDMAKNVESFITGIFGMTAAETASVAPTVAAEKTKGQAQAETAVVSQGQIPIVGFALMAAMAALVATMGFSTGGGGAAPEVSEPGTGTVLGDPTKQSESIQNSLDLLVEINSNDLAYSADMLASLKAIEGALADASALVAKQVMPLIDTVISQFSSSGMMNSSSVKEAGFLVGGQSLNKVLASGLLQGSLGARVESTTGLLGEFHSGKTMIAKYGNDIARVFGKIVESLYQNIVGASQKIGVSSDELAKRMNGLQVGLGKINIAGKSSEDAAKAIEAAFSAMGDKMARKLLPEFVDFQRNGEGYFETITRVGAGVADATGKLSQLGMQAVNYTAIENKRGDIAAEIARQTLVTQAKLGAGAKQYVSELTGSIDDILEAYKQIKEATAFMVGMGILDPNKFNRDMVNAAGGLDSFTEALSTFADEFLTPADVINRQAYTLRESFGALGKTLPATRDEFKKLIDGIDWTQKGADKLFGSLVALSPAFADYIANVDDFNQSIADLASGIADLRNSILDDIADLTAGSANLSLATSRVTDLWSKANATIGVDGSKVSYEDQLSMLSDLRSGIMGRYQLELAAIKESSQASALAIKKEAQDKVAALKESTAAQVVAIKSNTQDRIDQINATLSAEIDAKQKAHEAALEALNGELEAANKLKAAVDQVRSYAKGMSLGPNSPLSPEAALREAQSQYQSLLARAQGGDAEAISGLSSAADAYLQSAKKYFGSGTQYVNTFEGVKRAMEQIGAMDVTDPDSIQAKVDLLRESQASELEELRKKASEQIDTIKAESEKQIAELNEASEKQITAIMDAANSQADKLTDPNSNKAILELRERTIAELQKLQDLTDRLEQSNNQRTNTLIDLNQMQYDEMAKQTSYLAVIASTTPPDLSSLNPIGPFLPGSNDNGTLNNTMQAVATETKASVTLQSNAFTQMIDSLTNIDDRLSKMERNQRLSA